MRTEDGRMTLTLLDWLAIAAYFAANVAIGLYYRRRATASTADYFVSGRNVSWWLAGTSMVATTFAADTPLAVTGLVASFGIAGNWLWWSMLMSGMLTVFFYARLWRRAGVLTDVEFAEIRYAGRPAAFLRGFRALYLGLPINLIIMGWVNLAMVKILVTIFGLTKVLALAVVFAMMLVTAFISTLSGLWGVLVMDLFQFALKMGMVIVLAVFAVRAVGGMDALAERLHALDRARAASGGGGGSILSFTPDIGSAWMPMLTFFVYVAVNWWATWYPGAEPGGGGYIAQRIFCAKDEKHSLLATLWFNVAHYAVRPWPWVLTALASLVLYPGLADKESGFVKTIVDPAVFPVALRGVMLAAFAAAYMSSVGTQLNWGASYLVNDFYRRFLVRGGSESHYVRVAQAATVFVMLASCAVTWYQESIAGAWTFLIAVGAGTGSVFILRWFWWRINAWSEVSAMAASFVVSILLQVGFGLRSDDPREFAWIVLITVAASTLVWLAATWLTPPEPEETLLAFYRRVRPSASLWGPIAAAARDVVPPRDGLSNLMDWGAGCVLVYASLFGVGKIIFGEPALGFGMLLVAAAAGWLIRWDLDRRGWKAVVE
jgi:solute:Na+ symporter, SSS family